MRSFAVVALLLLSFAFAETQESLYIDALKAEESGDIAAALLLFEKASALDGEYTAEIREILESYKSALEDSVVENPWSFRFLGDLGFFALHYGEENSLGDVKENGGDLFISMVGFFDLELTNWTHSFGLAFVSDWFLGNDNMPVLDTCDWSFAPGLEYALAGRNTLVDLGVDFNLNSDADFAPSVYAWMEQSFFWFENQRLGVAAWAYYHDEGPASVALYGALHRDVKQGFAFDVFVGVKYDVDSLAYVTENGAESAPDSGYGEEPKPFQYYMDLCVADYGEEECRDLHNGLVQSYMSLSDDGNRMSYSHYWTQFLGPVLRSKLSYRLENGLSFDLKLNSFYAFVIDGVSSDYESLRKLSLTWGVTCLWKYRFVTFYAGIEQIYLHYYLPDSVRDLFPEETSLFEFKLGAKFAF